MKLHELKNVLAQNPAALVRFQLPNGEFVPAHAHVTEVARIDKRWRWKNVCHPPLPVRNSAR